jgi:hypothetical protein
MLASSSASAKRIAGNFPAYFSNPTANDWISGSHRAGDGRGGGTAQNPIIDWTGLYVGGHVGYPRGSSQVTLGDPETGRSGAPSAACRALLLQGLVGRVLALRGLESNDLNGSGRVAVRAHLISSQRVDADVEKIQPRADYHCRALAGWRST